MPYQLCTASDEFGRCHREIYVRARDYPRDGVLCQGHAYLRPPRPEHTSLNLIVPTTLKARIVQEASMSEKSVNQYVTGLLTWALDMATAQPNIKLPEEPP